MKKLYNTPEYEVERFTIQTQICTSGGLLDGNTDIDLEGLSNEEIDYLNGGAEY